MNQAVDLKLRARIANAAFKVARSPDARTNFANREEILDLQRRRLRDMLGFVERESRFYRQYYGDHGVFARREIEVEDLPVLTKELLMDNFDSIVTLPGISRQIIDDYVASGEDWICDGKYLFIKSTGTSGYHTLNVLTIDELVLISGLVTSRTGFKDLTAARRAFLFGRDPSHLSYKFSCVSMPLVGEARHIPTQQSVEAINEQLMAFDPDFISSFPSSLRVVIDQVKCGHLKLRRGLRVLSSGEMLDPALVNDFVEHLGTTPYNLFTCIEASPIAQDCPHHTLHINEDWFIVEPDPGGGLVTSLLNHSVPILRFRFDDLFERVSAPCPCGSHFHALGVCDAKRTGQFYIEDAAGRRKKVNTMIFKDVIYKFPPIIQSQIEQVTPRAFLVRAFSRTPSETLRVDLLQRINDDLRAADIAADEIEVDLAFVQPHEMSARNGKVKHFIPWSWGP
jgi:phenylacetate-coenzyme A ligase PaaK-like adenylate-forming protein